MIFSDRKAHFCRMQAKKADPKIKDPKLVFCPGIKKNSLPVYVKAMSFENA